MSEQGQVQEALVEMLRRGVLRVGREMVPYSSCTCEGPPHALYCPEWEPGGEE